MKLSFYNLYMKNDEGDVMLYNTRKGSLMYLTRQRYEQYLETLNNSSANEMVSNELFKNLINKGFLVDNEVDELEAIRKAHYRERQSNSSFGLTITPTMACNLDCPYCYESNKYAGLMSEETQYDLVKFVDTNLRKNAKAFHVTWYGGEPLIGISIIKNLSNQFMTLCQKYHCSYSAYVVTNGTLLSDRTIDTLVLSKVKGMQVTLDGPPETHDKHRPYVDGRPTFDTILDNLSRAAPRIRISVRVNTDVIVADKLEQLLQILSGKGLNKFVSVYLAPIHDAHAQNGSSPCGQGCGSRSGTQDLVQIKPLSAKNNETMNRKIFSDIEFKFDSLLKRYGFRTNLQVKQPKLHTCMADKDNSWLIEANGDVHKCWELAGSRSEAVGSLKDGEIILNSNFTKWKNWSVFDQPTCKKCKMLPVCMGFCPVEHITEDPDFCPAYKHNWDKILASIVLSQKRS